MLVGTMQSVEDLNRTERKKEEFTPSAFCMLKHQSSLVLGLGLILPAPFVLRPPDSGLGLELHLLMEDHGISQALREWANSS